MSRTPIECDCYRFRYDSGQSVMAARTFPNETKSADDAARGEILQRCPELRGKSLEAMRRILRREARA
jgi:hypothetical protein